MRQKSFNKTSVVSASVDIEEESHLLRHWEAFIPPKIIFKQITTQIEFDSIKNPSQTATPFIRVRGDLDSSCASKDSPDSPEPLSQKSAHGNRKKDRTRFPEKSLSADNSIA
ncbi:hypothetical protein CDAR_42651 [Caerostris darwini]|uniref:Uncharacterized protein n=1 Tax=Caerostris darwini TaxID=1538125 RepID=A0AAV4RWY2_9ARAC|nr:hypothetical protein CDAR_42651 [Caerostris darwini]